ncbi:DMT family transporter [Gellertiella hungarica]|uniref:Drug/metabolite transporter (DMT)-like permease n=1 Tax=Gellertiella hungarica TaxID=1572859 RepID=A0A7W6NIC9_9HYPH|nr:DMT family transporter [Gellertiella hungarica]MBB4063230.1 drug/metabolite transporter (DMT)-like permease [Gellertiella hungarica]
MQKVSSPSDVKRGRVLAHLAMLLFAALIAGSFSFGGLAARAMDTGVLTFLRYVATVFVMGFLAYGVSRQPFAWPKQAWRFLILGGLISFYMLTMFKALEFTSPVSTGAVFTLMPLMSAGFALLINRQKTRAAVLTSLVIAAAGAVWVIFRGDINAILAFDVGQGEMIYFTGVLAHAIYVPLIRTFDRGEHPVVFGFWVTVFATGFLALRAGPYLADVDYAAVSPLVWWSLAYLAVVTTAITFMLLQFASMRLPAPKVLAYGYLTPSFIILLEGVLGHGWVTLPVVAGALVTALGLAWMAALKD